jgi:plastocyanin
MTATGAGKPVPETRIPSPARTSEGAKVREVDKVREIDMAVPRIAVVVPLLLAGVLLPAVGPAPDEPPSGTLGMSHEGFSRTVVTVDCGQRLRMQNDSRWVHIVGPGRDGLLDAASAAVPVPERELLETDDSYTTGAWTTPGVHYLTCSVHPEMTVKVVVRPC